ncbi:MAG TPA: hypothetical protein V6C52_01980 [Coleofasciculaceae cyanobacterium]
MSHVQPIKKRGKTEFMVLLFLLAAAGLGGLSLASGSLSGGQPTSDLFSENLIGSKMPLPLEQPGSGLPIRAIPSQYKTLGNVDDRYTVAVDPESGAMLIHDAMGGIGTNNTSVEGVRARLANDMVNVEDYAKQNKGNLPEDAYDWLRKVARVGTNLAFGAPGLPANMQPKIKQQLLAELHHISANPTESIMHTEKFLELEKTFNLLDQAYAKNYANPSPSADPTMDYLSYDPLSPPLVTTLDYTGSGTLAGTLSTANLSPNLTAIASASSPTGYVTVSDSTIAVAPTSNTTTSPTTTATVSPATTATISPTVTATVSPTTTAATSPTLSVAGYYDSVLGTNLTSSSTGGPTGTTTTSTLSPSFTTTTAP